LHMDNLSPTPLHRRTPLYFLVDGLQVWVSYLDENKHKPYGVMFMWMETANSTSQLNHVTDDGGYSYQKYESYGMPDGTKDMRPVAPETDQEKLSRLQRIWVVYQQTLGEKVFSA
jgi:hypothetical protein